MNRVEQHGKISKGDTVKVRGTRGSFVVYWIDCFDDRLPEFTVVGGSHGRVAWRTFREDVVTKAPKRRTRKVV
jgi:hypothetical protein